MHMKHSNRSLITSRTKPLLTLAVAASLACSAVMSAAAQNARASKGEAPRGNPPARNGAPLGGGGKDRVVGLGADWQVIPQAITADPQILGDAFGSACAMNEDGTILVVGASDETVNSVAAAGAVHIFEYDDASAAFVHVQKIPAPPPQNNAGLVVGTPAIGLFGWSVAISGETIVVGAPIASVPGAPVFAGRAFVFQRSPDDNLWGTTATFEDEEGGGILTYRVANRVLRAGDQEQIGYFGGSVAVGVEPGLLSDTRIAVGSPYQGAANQGAVYLFEGSESTFTQVRKLTLEDAVAQDQFGSQLAIDGDVLVVGAQNADSDDAVNTGAAFVYRRSKGDAGTWGATAEATLAYDGATSNDAFGASVSVQGDSIAIGAPGFDEDIDGGLSSGEGAVFLFRREAGSWVEDGVVFAREANANNAFGYSARLAVNGDMLIVGCPGYETAAPDGVNAGAGFVFNRGVGGDWTIESSDLWTPSARKAQGVGEVLAVSANGSRAVLGSRHNINALGVPIVTSLFGWTFGENAIASPDVVAAVRAPTPEAPGASGYAEGTTTTGPGTGGSAPSTGGFGSGTTVPATPTIEPWGVARASVIAIDRAQHRVAIMLTDGNGALETESETIDYLGFYDPTWIPLGVGDVNGDRSSDVVFLVPATRKVKAWLRVGRRVTEIITVGTISVGDTYVGMGDWTNSGADAPAFLAADGETIKFWVVQGGAVTNKVEGDLGAGNWQFRVVDINDDGRREVIAVDPDRNVVLSATVNLSNTVVVTESTGPSKGFILADAEDYDSDGTIDFLWTDPSARKLTFQFRNTNGSIRFEQPWDSNINDWTINPGANFVVAGGRGVMFSKGNEILVVTVRYEAITTPPAGRGYIRCPYSRILQGIESGFEILGPAREPAS